MLGYGREVDGVAGGADGAEQVRLAVRVQRPPEPADRGVDGAQLDVLIAPPDQIEQLIAREHPAGAFEQLAQQAELGRAEMHLAAAARHPVRRKVHDEVGKAQRLPGERRPDPAQDGAHPRDQLVDRERLGHVVVGAGIEALQPVALLDARGQHDDRQIRGRRLPPQLAAQLEAGHVRQHPVQEHQIGRLLGDQRARLVGVIGLLDREAGALQVVGEQLLQGGLVLDHQDPRPHRAIDLMSSPCSASG